MEGRFKPSGKAPLTSTLSPCGNFRIIPATIGGAKQVLDDLSLVERLERARLGITGNEAVYQAVAEERAWTLITSKGPFKTLAIFGVSGAPLEFGQADEAIPVRYVWFLPTQYLIDTYRRDVADADKVKWVLDFIWSSIPTHIDKQPVVLFNGVTLANKAVLRWLKRVVGARISEKVIPAGPAHAPSHPFFLHHEPSYV